MITIDVQTERACHWGLHGGWEYDITIYRDSRPGPDGATPPFGPPSVFRIDRMSEHTVRLSWADHEHWCGGRLAPSTLIERLIGILIEHEGERPLPQRFDASTARRWHPRIDSVIIDACRLSA